MRAAACSAATSPRGRSGAGTGAGRAREPAPRPEKVSKTEGRRFEPCRPCPCCVTWPPCAETEIVALFTLGSLNSSSTTLETTKFDVGPLLSSGDHGEQLVENLREGNLFQAKKSMSSWLTRSASS